MSWEVHSEMRRGQQVVGVIILACGVAGGAARAGDSAMPEGWRRVDAGGFFSFFVPPDLQRSYKGGEDSYVEEYSSQTLHVQFDYGMYSGDLSYPSSHEYQATTAVVGGKTAKLATFRFDGQERWAGLAYCAGIHFPDVGPGMWEGASRKLTFLACGKTHADQDTAERIFRSIQFTSRPPEEDEARQDTPQIPPDVQQAIEVLLSSGGEHRPSAPVTQALQVLEQFDPSEQDGPAKQLSTGDYVAMRRHAKCDIHVTYLRDAAGNEGYRITKIAIPDAP